MNGKPIAFPQLRSFHDLFEGAKPWKTGATGGIVWTFPVEKYTRAGKKRKTTGRMTIGPYLSIRGEGGHHDSLQVKPKAFVVEWIKRNMITIEYDTLSFEIVVHGPDQALVIVAHNQIIGSRYLAMIDPSTIPSGESGTLNSTRGTSASRKRRARHGSIISVYDTGDRTADRYTVVVGTNVYGMSSDALSPNGFNQYIGEVRDLPGHNRGRKVSVASLPAAVKEAIQRRAAVEPTGWMEPSIARNRARGTVKTRKSPLTAATRVATLASLGVSYDPSLFYSVKAGKLYVRARTGGGGYGRGRLGKATLLGTIPGFKKGLFYSVSKGVVSVRKRK